MRHSVLSSVVTAAALGLVLAATALDASAQCPGNKWEIGANAKVWSSTVWSDHGLQEFRGEGCNGLPNGAVQTCKTQRIEGSYPLIYLTAKWANTSARVNDSTGGCVFVCDSGTCRVGNDGLPVELMQFGVE